MTRRLVELVELGNTSLAGARGELQACDDDGAPTDGRVEAGPRRRPSGAGIHLHRLAVTAGLVEVLPQAAAPAPGWLDRNAAPDRKAVARLVAGGSA